jgi:hypothetical protein
MMSHINMKVMTKSKQESTIVRQIGDCSKQKEMDPMTRIPGIITNQVKALASSHVSKEKPIDVFVIGLYMHVSSRIYISQIMNGKYVRLSDIRYAAYLVDDLYIMKKL